MTDARTYADEILEAPDLAGSRRLKALATAYLAALQRADTAEAERDWERERANENAAWGWRACDGAFKALAALRPFAEAFASHRVRYERVKSTHFDKMPGEWTINLEVTMADGRNAEAALAQPAPTGEAEGELKSDVTAILQQHMPGWPGLGELADKLVAETRLREPSR